VPAREVPPEILDLAERRSAARSSRDFALADALREELTAAGWRVKDGPGGWRLEPRVEEQPTRVRAAEVVSALGDRPDADASVQWVLEGWPDDVRRGLEAFRANAGARRIHYLVADVTGECVPGTFGDEVEVLALAPGTGWAAARNAGLIRSRGGIVLAVDGSIEPIGDVFGPLEAALADPGIGICGPFGVVTHDLREFHEAAGPGDCDAIEGYLMAFRREVLSTVGLFDEKFRWYRTADIEWSFRVKDAGLRTVVVRVPVTRHEHRAWSAATPEERASRSKRNFYRFLGRWRDRWDLTVAGEPPPHDH
jgi:hypothetical protein